jgi:hypothetical protein
LVQFLLLVRLTKPLDPSTVTEEFKHNFLFHGVILSLLSASLNFRLWVYYGECWAREVHGDIVGTGPEDHGVDVVMHQTIVALNSGSRLNVRPPLHKEGIGGALSLWPFDHGVIHVL